MNVNIDIYLRNAFRELDAFAIQGIGTFRKVHRAASVEEKSEKIQPPSIRLEFSPQVDDKVLLNRFFRDNIQLPPADADRIVVAIEQRIRTSLQQEGQFDIPEIGQLIRKPDGILDFSAYESAYPEMGGEYFGLQSVPLPKAPVSDLELAAQSDASEMANSITPPKSARSQAWKPVLIIALFLVMGGLILQRSPLVKHRASKITGVQIRYNAPRPVDEALAANTDEPEDIDAIEGNSSVEGDTSPTSPEVPNATDVLAQNEESANALPAGANARTAPPTSRGQDSSDQPIDLDASSNVADLAPGANARTVAPETARRADQPVFHLIGASFTEQDAAERYLEDLQDQGKEGMILFPTSGSGDRYRVSLFRSQDRTVVERFKARLQAKAPDTSYWIFTED
ncbi:MAG: SPOR domain-containing protein [Bacteroidota bacterium]